MATTQDGIIGAGFRVISVYTKNADGDMIGSDSTEPTAGASTGTTGLRVEGAQTVPLGLPDSELVDVTGDDSPQVQFDFGESTLPNGNLEVSTRNLYLEAMVQGTTVYTIGNIVAGVMQPEARNLANLAVLLQRRAKTWAPGSRGNEKWELLFVPALTMTPKGLADWTQRAHGPYRFGMSVSKGNLMAWGETFYTGAFNTPSGALEPVKANYPYHNDFFKGNGVNATFNLTKTPVVADTAVVTVARVIVSSVNYALSTAPNLITFTGGNEPAAGSLVNVFYPIEESEL